MGDGDLARLEAAVQAVVRRLLRSSEHLAGQLEDVLDGEIEIGDLPGRETPAGMLNVLTRVVKTLAQLCAQPGDGDGRGAEAGPVLSEQERLHRLNALLERIGKGVAGSDADAAGLDAAAGAADDGAGKPG